MGAEAIGGAAAEDDEAYGLGILEDGRGVCAKCHVQMANGWVAILFAGCIVCCFHGNRSLKTRN